MARQYTIRQAKVLIFNLGKQLKEESVPRAVQRLRALLAFTVRSPSKLTTITHTEDLVQKHAGPCLLLSSITQEILS